MLRQYGISSRRVSLIMRLRTKTMRIIQIGMLLLYLLSLMAEFIYHDLSYDERLNEYLTIRDS